MPRQPAPWPANGARAGTYTLRAGEGAADYHDGRLHRAGRPITESYLVFTVSGSRERTDWATIPEISGRLDGLPAPRKH